LSAKKTVAGVRFMLDNLVLSSMKEIFIVEFGPKFCQAQFEDFLQTESWEKSFADENRTILFDLTLTEWISTEQICFLFAWIRALKLLHRKVNVKLPFRNELNLIYSRQKLQVLGVKFKNPVTGELFRDSDVAKGRRRRSAAFLMDVYGMFHKLELDESDFLQMTDYATYNREAHEIRKYNHQIIGFTPFELKIADPGIKYDTHFFELISDNTESDAKTRGLFELQASLQELLKKYGCYNPFESKILSNVVTQELFTNSLQHSFELNIKKLFPECYVTAFLANKWETNDSAIHDQVYLAEKYAEALDFFKDKELIRAEINHVLQEPKNKSIKPRIADLKSFISHFKNQSYLEYTFLDFGDGIMSTLEAEFDKSVERGNLNTESLSTDFNTSANKENKVIEYAFLMDSSKNPLDKRIEYFDLVPRGLYFLIDMIRRYKGMLIVRSGKGKVIYDFSDKIIIKNTGSTPLAVIESKVTISESIKYSNDDLHTFPGSMFTIVIPSQEDETVNGRKNMNQSSNDRAVGAVRPDDPQLAEYSYSIRYVDYEPLEYPRNIFTASRFHYVGVLLLYNEILDQLKKLDTDIEIKDVYNKLLISVNSTIDDARSSNRIIFFDFAGLRSGNALWIKILYYLINTPKINEKTKAIIFNLPADEQKIVTRIKENLAGYDDNGKKRRINPHDPFLYKPIPCIKYKIDAAKPSEQIEWIGLKNIADEELLTSLFLGMKDQYSVTRFESPSAAIGNIFVQSKGWIMPTFSGLTKLNNLFLSRQKEATLDFLKSHIINGVEIAVVDGAVHEIERIVFLTANGGFQLQYLTLYELLHDKYIARYFAKCLLDKYAAYVQVQLTNREAGNFNNIQEYSFSKIIAVTVSSQLIGIAIRDLIVEDDCYSFLRKEITTQSGLDLAPELIMLSSYYSFETEKPFEKITDEDRVLIVNDVISTGKLVGNLLTKIEEEKKARINCVFSIADTRIPHSERETDKLREEEKCDFFDQFESRFITLAAFDDGIDLRKYKGPYRGPAELKRINPLLNTVVELRAKHGEQQKVIFPNLSNFLQDLAIDEGYLKIGHFQQNMTHNGYLTNMRELFSGHKGVEILKRIKVEIENKGFLTATGSPREFIISRLTSISQQVEKLAKGLKNPNYIDKSKALAAAITDFQELLNAEKPLGSGSGGYHPDFIFYPIFSGIERANYLKLSEIFGTHPDNIIGLQRFETPKGWRFPFPAKRYNEVTRNQSILILDAGSLTGESLVQLIDNIGFLDVKQILVISVISRVEDFFREFYSRLKSLNVKKLRSKENTIQSDILKSENIVPIEIVFGISLHIPVYSSAASCPFCEELNSLNIISDSSHYAKQTHQVKEYIKMRKDELKALNNTTDILNNIRYLPVSKTNGKVDTKGIFDTRDFIGKIDSYRFYPEYFSDLNDLQDRVISDEKWFLDFETQRDIERILICILHEPNLLELIGSYGNGLDKTLKLYILKFNFEPDNKTLHFFYEWSYYAILKLSFIILKSEILTIDFFLKILAWDDDDSNLLMHFKLWDILHGRKSRPKERDLVEALLKKYTDLFTATDAGGPVFAAKNKEYARILIRNYGLNDVSGYDKLDLPFYNLSKFVYQGELQDRHFFLKEGLNHIIDAIISTKPSIEQISAKVHDVLYIFDAELRPSIEKIVGDQAVRDTCKVLYTHLSGEKIGILYYMNRIEEIYQRIVNVKQENIESVRETFPMLQDISRTMVNQVLTTTEEKECFYRLCKEYPWSLEKALAYIQTKQTNQTTIIFDSGSVDVNIAIHRHVIEAMLEEIIKNAKARYPDGIEVTFIYEFSPDGEYVKLVASQNCPFIESGIEKRTGGLSQIVKYFAEKFGGSYADNREDSLASNTEFEIILHLKLHSYVK
jgi:hypothetical protein